jgi:hypothetical protein
MNDEIKQMLDKIRGVGTNLTFEREFVADFVERLDKVVEVQGVKLDGAVMKMLIGEPRAPSQEDILKVIIKASLLNVAAAGYEDSEHGKVLYLEYYMPPWSEVYV